MEGQSSSIFTSVARTTNYRQTFLSLSTVKGEHIVLVAHYSRHSIAGICMITTWGFGDWDL